MFLQPLQISDEELVRNYCSSNNKDILGELFKRHSLMCFTVCNKFLKDENLAQDATMEIYEKLIVDLTKHEIQNFRSWLHSVCRNYCLMQLRKRESKIRKSTIYLDDEDTFMELQNLVHPNANEKENQLILLEKAIEGLKDQQRRCIELFYLQQKSYDEICEITGFSNKDVKSHIQNGKRNLKINLGTIEFVFWFITLWKI